MIIRHCSDLHLEFGIDCRENQLIAKDGNPAQEILLVNGDTVLTDYLRLNRTDADARSLQKRFRKFLAQVAPYKKVIFSRGNHEGYQGDYLEGHDAFNTFLQDAGYAPTHMCFVDDEMFELEPGVHLLVGALWTDMNKDNPVTHQCVGEAMNDFRAIRYGNRTFTTHDAVSIHRRSLANLGEMYQYLTHDYEKKKPDGKTQIIVMTHWHPSVQGLKGSYRHDGGASHSDFGYYSDLSDWVLDRPQITHWFVGHTHHPCNYMIGNCNVISNPRGYGVPRHKDACFDDFNVDDGIEVGRVREHANTA